MTEKEEKGTARQIVATVCNEYRKGQHQQTAQDLPFEIQFRLHCSWGRALSYANTIRLGGVES